MSVSRDDHDLNDPEYAKAIGIFVLNYNVLEKTIYRFFQRYLPDHNHERSFIFSKLSNQDKISFIRTTSRIRDPGISEKYINHALDCFDICNRNRNILLHLTILLKTQESDNHIMFNMNKKETQKVVLYNFNADTILNSAVEILEITDFINSVLNRMEENNILNMLGISFDDLQEPTLPRSLDDLKIQ